MPVVTVASDCDDSSASCELSSLIVDVGVAVITVEVGVGVSVTLVVGVGVSVITAVVGVGVAVGVVGVGFGDGVVGVGFGDGLEFTEGCVRVDACDKCSWDDASETSWEDSALDVHSWDDASRHRMAKSVLSRRSIRLRSDTGSHLQQAVLRGVRRVFKTIYKIIINNYKCIYYVVAHTHLWGRIAIVAPDLHFGRVKISVV